MSDHGFDDDADLTPFELALAGATAAESTRGPSARVVDDMRLLLDEVDETPVLLAGLRDFLDNGASTGVDPERWLPRAEAGRRGSVGGGAFIDITPIELTGARPARPAADPSASRIPAPPVEPPAAEVADTRADVPGDGTAPPAARDRSGDDGGGPEDATGPGRDADTPIEDARPPGDATRTGEDDGGRDHAEPEGDDQGTMADVDSVHASLRQVLDGTEPDLSPSAVVDTGQIRGPSGRFNAVPGDGPAPDEDGEDEDEVITGPIAIGAGIDGPVEAVDAETASTPPSPADQPGDGAPSGEAPDDRGSILQPVALGAATTGPPLAAPTRVAEPIGPGLGGKLTTALAVAGTAAAAALVLGGIWWASTSNRIGTEEATADRVASTVAATSEPPTGGSSTATEATGSGTADGPAAFGPTSAAGTSTTIEVELPPASTASTTGARSSTSATSPPTTASSTSAEATTTSVATTAATVATTVSQPPPTTERPTTTAPPALAYIGDQVSVGGYDGPGLGGVGVELWVDADRDGRADRLEARATTSSSGRYSFDIPAGCYEVRFGAPDGYEIRSDLATQRLCVEPGQSAARVDAIALPPVAPPSGCAVDPPGSYFLYGVRVVENDRDWADSYIFHDRNGSVVVDTASLGNADRIHSRTVREWTIGRYRYDHRAVHAVSAVRDGRTSSAVSCSR